MVLVLAVVLKITNNRCMMVTNEFNSSVVNGYKSIHRENEKDG